MTVTAVTGPGIMTPVSDIAATEVRNKASSIRLIKHEGPSKAFLTLIESMKGGEKLRLQTSPVAPKALKVLKE
jgi:hypothetical protein